MNSFFSFPVSIVLLFASLCTATVYSQNQEKYIEGIAAIVGDNVILKSDLSQVVSMTALQHRIDPNKNPKRFQTLQHEVLQSLVDQKIILEMAELDSIEVKEKDVDNALNQQIETFVSQAGSEEKAETSLGQSLSSFRREFWYEMRDRLISEQFQYSLLSNIKTNREDVFSFFKT
jgi:peptidyl-prolyl cis-trans isomerase SurA